MVLRYDCRVDAALLRLVTIGGMALSELRSAWSCRSTSCAARCFPSPSSSFPACSTCPDTSLCGCALCALRPDALAEPLRSRSELSRSCAARRADAIRGDGGMSIGGGGRTPNFLVRRLGDDDVTDAPAVASLRSSTSAEPPSCGDRGVAPAPWRSLLRPRFSRSTRRLSTVATSEGSLHVPRFSRTCQRSTQNRRRAAVVDWLGRPMYLMARTRSGLS